MPTNNHPKTTLIGWKTSISYAQSHIISKEGWHDQRLGFPVLGAPATYIRP